MSSKQISLQVSVKFSKAYCRTSCHTNAQMQRKPPNISPDFPVWWPPCTACTLDAAVLAWIMLRKKEQSRKPAELPPRLSCQRWFHVSVGDAGQRYVHQQVVELTMTRRDVVMKNKKKQTSQNVDDGETFRSFLSILVVVPRNHSVVYSVKCKHSTHNFYLENCICVLR